MECWRVNVIRKTSLYLYFLLWVAVVVSSFKTAPFFVPSPRYGKRSAVVHRRPVALMNPVEKQQQQQQPQLHLIQPQYQIGHLDLSNEWMNLVENDKVSATVKIPNNNASSDGKNKPASSSVKYGVRIAEGKHGCQGYVMEVGLQPGEASSNPQIQAINSTLARIQQQQPDQPSSECASGATFKEAGGFVAQLQLVRTLRPPPSPGFSGATTSVPPKYNAETDSFVTGPLRLELRPLVGRIHQLSASSSSNQNNDLVTPWDVFHNVSPADTRGHFLLLPTLADKERNWRGQIFTHDDCHDVVHIANAIEPPGSLMIGYNSVGAGASQNHIHCHAWPGPPVPLLGSTTDGWSAYPVSNVSSICDFCDVMMEDEEDGLVEVSFLDYPVFTVLLSASSTHLSVLGEALAVVLECVDTLSHNIAFLNRIAHDEGENDGEDENDDNGAGETVERFVDVYVFARSKERSKVLPTLKLGVSEMMGVFHAQSDEELERLTSTIRPKKEDGSSEATSCMEQALLDVNVKNEEELWLAMKDKLESLPKAALHEQG